MSWKTGKSLGGGRTVILLSDIILFVIFVAVFLLGFWIGCDEHENHRDFWRNLKERLSGVDENKTS